LVSGVARGLSALAVAGAGALAYGGLIERNWFTVRKFAAPVLDPGSPALRVLHISDLHMTSGQRRKQEYVSSLARLQPDLVINTGDTSSDPDAIPQIMDCLGPLFDFPGAFVPGNNDYYTPIPKNPFRYFLSNRVGRLEARRRMPWAALSAEMQSRGWLDLTHVRSVVTAGGQRVALTGTDDAHLRRDRYEKVAGRASPDAAVRIGVIHTPEPALLSAFAADGYDLVLGGHTHGGQVRIPFGPAVTTNCGIDVRRARWLHRWDERMWFNICAGLGTNPYMPVRFACRPEAVLLTLLPRDMPRVS